MEDKKKLFQKAETEQPQDAAKGCELDDEALEGVAGGIVSSMLIEGTTEIKHL